MASEPREFRISVRELAEFVHRTGNLGGDGQFRAANRAVEGTRGHQRLQQSRGEGYQAEVPVERTFERDGVRVCLSGRLDGLRTSGDALFVEEIKTVDHRWTGQADPVHFAQARIYAALLLLAESRSRATVQLTYLDLATDETTVFREDHAREALLGFFEATLAAWLEWAAAHARWLAIRDASISGLPFPFVQYRKGQRPLAQSVYRTVRDSGRLFVEAPTGLGKSLAALFPVVKALPLLKDGQVFFVTAKTPGRQAAEDALDRLRASGLRLRSLTLTAKRKICFTDRPEGCDVRSCPFAIGYYDRVKPAVREVLEREKIDRPVLEEVAQARQVCPFELALDASLWTDVVIGDYNHVFDPVSRLVRHFSDGPVRHVVLVDEAHNLVDRSREMYSAALSIGELEVPSGAPGGTGSGKARRALARARRELEAVLAQPPPPSPEIPARPHHENAVACREMPESLAHGLRQAARALEAFLAAQPPGVDLSPWLPPWFAMHRWLKTAEAFDASYWTLLDPPAGRITLFCADPSPQLRETLQGLRAAVFFSATLSPLPYFRDLLGGRDGDRLERYPSPFRDDQMHLRISGHDVTFHERAGSLPAVARDIASHAAAMPGNHLVFCPSMDYIEQMDQELGRQGFEIPRFRQTASMSEPDREAFLAGFVPAGRRLGLAVIGGIFAEGIDLPGDRLVGVTVIGVGLPRLSLERDILRAHFEKTRGAGFDYAYRFPGLQRVLQAVGRLIRSEQDQGAALLIDRRYHEPRYRALLPPWWKPE